MPHNLAGHSVSRANARTNCLIIFKAAVDIRNVYGIFVRKSKGPDLLGDLCAGQKITLKLLLKNKEKGMDWIHLGQDQVQWWSLTKTTVSLQVP
jgi:hypothetical protein